MGEYCEPICAFGKKNTSNKCECDLGYWNTTCNTVCPGGNSRPCNGYGNCDQLSGKCPCPINRESSLDCSMCTSGWLGENCEIAENNVSSTNKSVAMFSGFGHVYNLDGLFYIVRIPSEYTFLTVADNVLIIGKLVSCFQNYTCLTFVGIRINDDVNGYVSTTVQYPIGKYNSLVFYLENEKKSLDTPLYFNGISISKTRPDEIKYVINSEIEIKVRLQGKYLSFQINLPINLVPRTTGLLSGNGSMESNTKLNHLLYSEVYQIRTCESTIGRQTPSFTPSGGQVLFNNVLLNITLNGNTKLNFERFQVSLCDRIIFYPSKSFEIQGVGGYSLNFQFANVFTLIDFAKDTGNNLTLEFLVKLKNSSETGGLILSVTNNNSFLLVSTPFLEIHYNNQIFNTSIQLEKGIWNKVVLMYVKNTGDTDLYQFNGTGFVQRRNIKLPANIFDSPALLSVGNSQPPPNAVPFRLIPSLSGQIDNVIIWNIPIEPNVILDIWKIDPLEIKHLLISVWTFNEGYGSKSLDLLHERKISFPLEPWSLPSWEPSDYEYSKSFYPEISSFYFGDPSLELLGEQICNRIFFDPTIYSKCSEISNSIKTVHYLSCMQSLSATGEQHSAYNLLLQYGEICQILMNPLSSITDEICKTINDSIKDETICNRMCKNGVLSMSGKCECFHGFFSSACNQSCPGGSLNPCSNHGICDEIGTCQCEWNWATPNCSSCVEGIDGIDCHVLTLPLSRGFGNRYISYLTGFADYLTFQDEQISLDNISGAFKLFQSPSVDIQVYQVVCSMGSCVIAVYFQYKTTSIVIVSSGHADKLPIVYLNNSEHDFENLETVTSEIQLALISMNEVHINTTFLELRILAQANTLDIAVNSNSLCSTGILCPGVAYSLKTEEEISNFVSVNYKLNSGAFIDTLTSVFNENFANSEGFSLFFNGTATLSLPIHYPNKLFDETLFSVSFYFKPLRTGGVIITYSGNSTFSVLNTDPVSIQCGDTTVYTNISVSNNVWNQMLFTFESVLSDDYEKDVRKVHIYHFDAISFITYQKVTISCNELFEEDGIVGLGAWVPSVQNKKRNVADFFYGYIDEFSIWKDPVPYEVVVQAQNLNLKLSGFENNLTALFSFSEGIGTTTFDAILGNNLYLPTFPWQGPSWKPSDLKLRKLTDSRIIFQTFSREAVFLCSQFFDSLLVKQQCSQFSSQGFLWFKQKCSKFATMHVNKAIVAMASFVKSCEAVSMVSKNDLYHIICNLNVTVPEWILNLCNKCLFGKAGITQDSNCTCYKGFYGNQCDKMCPNGAASPCSNHGECDTNGTCQCAGHWTGEACESCDSHWEGEECVIMKTGNTLNQSLLVGQANVAGQIISFDGTTFDIRDLGNYIIFQDKFIAFKIHGYFSTCVSLSVNYLCLNMITIKINSEYYFIKTHGFQDNKVTIYSSRGEFNVYTIKEEENMSLLLKSPNVLRITIKEINLSLKITMISQRLLLTVILSKDIWSLNMATIGGLVTSCNTSKAIRLSSCSQISRFDICSDSGITSRSNCETSLSWNALTMYIQNHASNDSKIEGVLNNESIVTGSACMHFNGSGIYVNELVLPNKQFTLELSVNPETTDGPFLSYRENEQFLILHILKAELIITTNELQLNTGIALELHKWSQINLVWQKNIETLEIYVTSNLGKTVVKAVRLHSKIFLSSGTLTIGILGNIPNEENFGIFVGSIDEIRIWSRPHNPTIIVNNWKVKVSRDTVDVFRAWSLNDGVGPIASELKGTQNMFITNYNQPPTWVVADLEFVPNSGLSLPKFTETLPEMPISSKSCDELFEDTLKNAYAAYFEQCKKLVQETEDEFVAELLLISIAEVIHESSNQTIQPTQLKCQSFEKYESYIGFYGNNCSNECEFGTTILNNCTCDPLHYGQECRDACALGSNGICNTEGYCDMFSGFCNCERHWLGSETNIRIFWENYLEYTYKSFFNSSTTCSVCSIGLLAADCSVFVQQNNITISNVGFIFGSYVTTFDGVSYQMSISGIYNVFKNSDFSVQILFWPCYGDISCRFVREIAVQKGENVVNVLWIDEEMRLLQQQRKILEYPSDTTVGQISIKWVIEAYIRITAGSFSVLVSKSTTGLVCRFKISDFHESATGILGNADKIWWNDISDVILVNASISATSVGNWTKKQYSEKLTNIIISYPKRQQNLSSSGYLLRLKHHRVNFTNILSIYEFQVFTISFWIRLENGTSLYNSVIVIEFERYELHISIIRGILYINWEQTYVIGSINFAANTWIYFTMTWRSSDGLVNIYSMLEGSLQHHQFYSTIIGLKCNIRNIYLGYSDLQSHFEIEQIRVWKTIKGVGDILLDMEKYLGMNDKNLIVFVGFDEGFGLETILRDHSGSIARNVTGVISGENFTDLWQPSDIPIPVLNLRSSAPEPSTIQKQSIDRCLDALNHSDVLTHCRNVDVLGDFLLEACLAESSESDYNGTVPNRTIIENLIFYCQGVYNIDECKLTGYFDFCSKKETDSEFPIWAIILIGVFVVCLIIIIFVCICCCWYHGWCCCRKRRKWNPYPTHDFLVPDDDDDEIETVFGQYNMCLSTDTLDNRKQKFHDIWDKQFENREEAESPDPRPSSLPDVPLDFITFSKNDIDDEVKTHGPLPPLDTSYVPSPLPQFESDQSDIESPTHPPLFAINPMFESSEPDENNHTIWGPSTRKLPDDGNENSAFCRKVLYKEQEQWKAPEGNVTKKSKDLFKKQNIPVKHKREKPRDVKITCFDEPVVPDKRLVATPLSFGTHVRQQPLHSYRLYLKKNKDSKETKEKERVNSGASSERPGSSSSTSSAKFNPFVQPEKEEHDDSKGMDDVSPFHPQTEEEITSHALEIQRRPMSAGSQTHETVVSTGKESDSDEETTQSSTV